MQYDNDVIPQVHNIHYVQNIQYFTLYYIKALQLDPYVLYHNLLCYSSVYTVF